MRLKMPTIGPFEIEGKTYVTLEPARQIIGTNISRRTLGIWCGRGFRPWDLELDVVRQPVLKHAGGKKAIKPIHVRLLISEASTVILI
jgi:hypothetical protein